MEHNEFKKQMALLSNVTPKDAVQRQRITDLYSAQIKELINAINNTPSQARNTLLAQLKETDTLYLAAVNCKISGHVLFTRHGQCSVWDQKKYGINPNTSVAEPAVQAMANTKKTTQPLLFYPQNERPYIAISPMNRALQTAGLMIPEHISQAEISIEPALTEISTVPSGMDIRCKADMQKHYQATLFWKNPLQKISFLLALWFYKDAYFQDLHKKRQQATANIEKHGNNINTAKNNEGLPDVQQNLAYKGNKIEDIKKLMEHAGARDCWFFGHGRNFRRFFAQELGLAVLFDYGETLRVYKVQNATQHTSLFTPPYSVFINQNTGEIEGKYLGAIGKSKTHAEVPRHAQAQPGSINKIIDQLEPNGPEMQEKLDVNTEPYHSAPGAAPRAAKDEIEAKDALLPSHSERNKGISI